MIKNMEMNEFKDEQLLFQKQKVLLDSIEKMNKSLIKHLKKGEVGTKSSILYLNILNETKNMALQAGNVYKSQRDFVDYNSSRE